MDKVWQWLTFQTGQVWLQSQIQTALEQMAEAARQDTLRSFSRRWVMETTCGVATCFLVRCVIKRHPLNPARGRVTHFPSFPRPALAGIARHLAPKNSSDRSFLSLLSSEPTYYRLSQIHTYFPPINVFQLHTPCHHPSEEGEIKKIKH